MKRLLTLATLLLLAVASFAHDFEVDGIYYVITSSASTSPTVSVSYRGTSFDSYSNEYSGNIAIPETVTYSGKTYRVTSIADYAFISCTGLTSIDIPPSVMSIGNSAFYNCSGLSSVIIPNGVTSIYYDAFRNCTGLISVTIPESVTSIGVYAFSGCKELKKVIVKNIAAWCKISFATGTSSPLASSNPLSYAKHLYSEENIEITSLEIPDNVTSISSNAFESCIGLTSITIPEKVNQIGNYAFWGCENLVLIKNKAVTPPSIGSNTFSENTYNSSLLAVDESCTESYVSSTEWGRFKQIGVKYDEYPFTYVISKDDCVIKLLEKDGVKISYDGDINIPNTISISGNNYDVTRIADNAFSNSHIKKVNIADGIKEIGKNAFSNCTQLSSIYIPSNVATIGNYAFNGCTSLTDVTLNSNSIVSNANSTSSSLKNIFGTQVKAYTLGDKVTSIGNYAFYGCSGLTSITIPASVTTIGFSAFSGCFGLSRVTINSKDIVSKNYTSTPNISAIFGSQVKEYILGNEITSIGSNAFYNCKNTTSITLPNSLTDIGYSAFQGCSSLTAITIPCNVKNISYDSFYNCGELSSIVVETGNTLYDSRENSNAIIETSTNSLILGCKNTIIPSSVTKIASGAFYGCTGLTSIILPSSITTIGLSTFQSCTGLTSINIPEKVTYIGDKAFDGCSNLETAILPDKLVNITKASFPDNTKLHVNAGSLTLLILWNKSFSNIYEIGTENKLSAPYLSATSATQTKIKAKINNKYEGYTYKYNNRTINDDTFTAEGLCPESSYTIYVDVSKSGVYGISYSASVSATTRGINPTVIGAATSASSIFANGAYSQGDATFVKEVFKCNGKEVEGKNISVNGLNPNTSYNVDYTITVAYGDNNQYTKSFTGSKSVKTNSLTLTTEQPKVVSMGNVIVSATTNVDPEEKNVGFEWRREDWSSTFASQSGAAVVLDGTMEGYIRNLYTGKLWNYRAYYLSDSGTYYYGDWVGIDPTNTSYFEPTVHTYADISTSGKVALIRGYVLNGTDKITVQGFKYWKTANKSNSLDIAMEGEPQAAVVSIPADAITETVAIVGAGQQMMNATLKDLDYGSTYQCVAFATTSENETFYGEVQSFTTEADPTGIEGVKEDAGSSKAVTVVACYDLNGKRLAAPQKGMNILKMSDGTTRKVVK